MAVFETPVDMSRACEKAVKGATKIKLAAPKDKYIDQILLATQSGEAGVAQIFKTLQLRIRDSTWTIVFKAFVVVHLMIRGGRQDATLSYLSAAPDARLSTSDFTPVQTQGANIDAYANYLTVRARGYANTKHDYTQDQAVRRFKDLTVAKGLLKETAEILTQLKALLKCRSINDERNNPIASLAALLVLKDLIALYNTANQAVMSVLIHFFELSNIDATKAVKIYKMFVNQTEKIIDYIEDMKRSGQVAPHSLPIIRKANSKIIAQLEAHVNSPDFEQIRQQHVDSRKGGNVKSFAQASAVGTANTTNAVSPKKAEPVRTPAPAPDLIDFFDSIEQSNQGIGQQTFVPQQQHFAAPQQQQHFSGYGQMPPIMQVTTQQSMNYMAPQQTGYDVQQTPQTNPFLQQQSQQPQQMQSQYTAQLQPSYDQFNANNAFGQAQPQVQPQAQPQFMQLPGQPQLMLPQHTASHVGSTNPFRQSTMMTGSSSNYNLLGQQAQAFTNQQNNNNFMSSPAGSTPLQPQRTGTNPFARSGPTSQTSSPSTLQPMVTGSTNPFRQSQFINQETGRGWQNSAQQGTMGGLEQLQTVPVFPRPGQ